jgi:hypothetical protein
MICLKLRGPLKNGKIEGKIKIIIEIMQLIIMHHLLNYMLYAKHTNEINVFFACISTPGRLGKYA